MQPQHHTFILALLLTLALYSCSNSNNASGPSQLDLIHFDLTESTFTDEYRILTFEHQDLHVAKIIEIYRNDLGIYSPIDRKGISIEPGKMVIRDPDLYWRTSKIQCPSLEIVVAVLP